MSERKKKSSKQQEPTTTTTTSSSSSSANKKEAIVKQSETTKTAIEETSIDFQSLKYPIFCCATNNNLIATGGGGGTSSTGIPNGINLFKWNKDNTQRFKPLDTLETPDCVSNLSFQHKKDIFAYGIDNILYFIDYSNGNFKKLKEININDGRVSKSPTSPLSTSSSSTSSSSSNEKYEIQLSRFTKNDDKVFIVDSERNIKIYSNNSDESTLQSIIHTNHSNEINGIDIHPTSTYLATTSKDKTCKIINILSGKVEHTLQYKHRNQPLGFRGCKFSPDSVYLYTCQSTPRSKQFQGCSIVSKWEFLNGTCKELKSLEFQSSHNTTFEISPDGKHLAIGTADSKITIISTETLSKVERYEPHGFIITDLAFSPDSLSLFSVSVDYTCRSHKIGSSLSNERSKMKIAIIIISLIVLILSYFYNK